jgi:hypothetical protein
MVLAGGAAAASRSTVDACGLPTAAPVWIDYGEGTVGPDVRAVFARPGVVVASSGTAVPKYFRDKGAATTYFVLHLPALVGEPSDPADPASITAAADALFDKAVASTGCATPTIALNELLGSNLKTPWSASNATYRANILALMQELSQRGAHPVLFVHGDYDLSGQAADWWRQVSQAGQIVYELYYDASHVYALGTVLGNRRMRMGGRQLVADFGAIGVPPERLGIALGFYSSPTPGVAGRQGLQPREAWLRVVKWETLMAKQVAAETHLASIWSWGWAAFSADAQDPDKAAAACVYLWARDASLCDGPAAAGPAFNTSLVEGQIVLPEGVTCTLAAGHVRTDAVDALAAVTHNHHDALTAAFEQVALRSAAPVSQADVLAVEQQAVDRVFHGNRHGYLEALSRAHASLGVARAVIRDELRRRAIAKMLAGQGSTQTMLDWAAAREAKAVDTAICLHDDLPGTGAFPQTDEREVGVVPLLARLPFLFSDKTPPAAPAAPTATPGPGTVTLAWTSNPEADLAGYAVFRGTASGGPYQQIGPLLDRPTLTDSTAPAGTTSYYVIRAIDTSGNASAPSPEVSGVPGAAS